MVTIWQIGFLDGYFGHVKRPDLGNEYQDAYWDGFWQRFDERA